MSNTVVKRLRNKIWMILVASFYTLVITIVLILYLVSNQRAQEATHQALYSALLSNELYFSNVFLSTDITINGEIISIHSDFDMPAERYETLVRMVLENDRIHNTIELYGETWAYTYAPTGELFQYIGEAYQRIIFVNTSDIFARHHGLFRALIVIGIGSFLIVLSVSFVVAKYFIKSTKSSFEEQETITAQQKKFTANATHELKTPIAMIKGSYEEILRNKDQTIESQMKWFNMI